MAVYSKVSDGITSGTSADPTHPGSRDSTSNQVVRPRRVMRVATGSASSCQLVPQATTHTPPAGYHQYGGKRTAYDGSWWGFGAGVDGTDLWEPTLQVYSTRGSVAPELEFEFNILVP
ncbi:hypothetical protein K474DRAFT_1678886 [Panus rudis PR-1116 ss-1]|nr:hypothetical protein K474DRAFT_1678886 [Panus rudis PR-1116 ss-1]